MEVLVIEPDSLFSGELVSALATVGLSTRLARDGVAGRRALTSRKPSAVLYIAERLPDVPSGDLLADLERDPLWSVVPMVLRAELDDSVFASALVQSGQVVVTRESGALVIAELMRDGALQRAPDAPRWPEPLLDRARQMRTRSEDARNRSLALRAHAIRLAEPWRK